MDLSKVHCLARSRRSGTSRRDGSVGSLSMRVSSQDVCDLILHSLCQEIWRRRCSEMLMTLRLHKQETVVIE